MSNFVEQRSKFCLRNDISAAETSQKMFTSGTEILSVDDLQRSGRPSTSVDDQNIKKIKEMALGLRRVKLVLKFLKFVEKEGRVQACGAMLSDYQGVYKQIITGDEYWICAYAPEITDQSSECRLTNQIYLSKVVRISR